jgi:SAM-dependent methyltransferase
MTAVLDPREAYRIWAPSYDAENAITSIEDGLVAAMTPPLPGLRLLDAGCGTGRRLRAIDAAEVVGVDLSPEMLAQADLPPHVDLRVGDVRALPLDDAAFDLLWCRLVIGHLPDPDPVYRELARVAAPGATLVVSDFHPAAHRAGHRRSFRAGGIVHEAEHHVHLPDRQLAAAGQAGWRLVEMREGAIGPAVRAHYERAGKVDAYARDEGLCVVLALSFRKDA